jgi:hypothetical protein
VAHQPQRRHRRRRDLYWKLRDVTETRNGGEGDRRVIIVRYCKHTSSLFILIGIPTAIPTLIPRMKASADLHDVRDCLGHAHITTISRYVRSTPVRGVPCAGEALGVGDLLGSIGCRDITSTFLCLLRLQEKCPQLSHCGHPCFIEIST